MRRSFTTFFLMLVVGSACVAAPSSGQRAAIDARIVERLASNGELVERPQVKVFVETGALAPDLLAVFADRAGAAVAGIREYLGDQLQLRGGDNARDVEFYLSRDAGISHASRREPRVFIDPSRVAGDTAPYVHEAVHAMAAWTSRAQWIGEGFAEHVAAEVVSRVGGYHFVAVEPRGITSAPEHLSSEYGKQVLLVIGVVGSRADVAVEQRDLVAKISRERHTYGAAFYILSWSFVDYLVAQVGVGGIRAIAEGDGKDEEVVRATGKSLTEWKIAWLRQMKAGRRCGQSADC